MLVGIAGAGIGGLTLAVALHRRGVDVVVFERQDRLRDHGAGISLWPNAVAALDSVGLGEVVRDIGSPLASGGALSMSGRPAVTFSSSAFRAVLGEPLLCVDRGELVSALVSELPKSAVVAGSEVVGYARVRGQIVVQTKEHGEARAVDVLIGADGFNSRIATQIGGPLDRRPSGYTAWRAIAAFEQQDREDGFWACLHNGHELGWLPLPNCRTYWFATAMIDQIDTQATDYDYLRSRFMQHPDPLPSLIDATPPDALVRNDIIDRAMPRRWTDGAVAVLGDAAHPMRPHLGQGGCQAIEDASVLAQLLPGATSVVDALRQYERRRRRRAATVVRLSRLSRITFTPGWRTRALDTLLSSTPGLSINAALHGMRPIASYRAGVRAVAVSS